MVCPESARAGCQFGGERRFVFRRAGPRVGPRRQLVRGIVRCDRRGGCQRPLCWRGTIYPPGVRDSQRANTNPSLVIVILLLTDVTQCRPFFTAKARRTQRELVSPRRKKRLRGLSVFAVRFSCLLRKVSY